ncbi:MAG: winged helix-turn-helix domain-containing protein [Eubacteriales bacterium]|nr:winged helix-turn-helix domain-containing protein [Eubacteriales bacterium]
MLRLLWSNSLNGEARTVDVYIRRLRMKFERAPERPRFIKTKWGKGYYFQL